MAVNITAVTDKFMKGMQSAQGMIGKFTSNVFSMGGALASLAAGGFAVAMKSAIEFGDALTAR